jgi:hypothetical protein
MTITLYVSSYGFWMLIVASKFKLFRAENLLLTLGISYSTLNSALNLTATL